MQLEASMIKLDQSFESKTDAIKAAGQLLVEAGCVEGAYVDSMLERESVVSTHMGSFVAIPHGTEEGKSSVKKTGISILQVPHGVDFASEDEDEEKLAMMIFGIAGIGDEHLGLLSKIAIVCSDVQNVVRLTNADSPEEIIAIFEEAEQ